MRCPLEEKFAVISLLPYNRLAPPVSCHPDMLMFVKDKTLVLHSGYYEENKELFLPFSEHLILSHEDMGCRYPGDILFNALGIGNTLFGRCDFVSSHILGMFERTVNVAQGYAACSTLVLSENAIITADSTIARAARDNSVNVLEIAPGHIALPGYHYGFIGGASFVYGSTVYFFGNTDDHPDSARIKDFIHDQGMELICLDPHAPLSDFGSGKIFCI